MLSIAGTERQSRFQRRLRLHLTFFLLSTGLSVAFMWLFPRRDLVSRLSIGTAYPALLFTAATLLVGPLNILRRKRNPVSSDVRRDLGIWSGVLALLHTVVGLNVHLRGRPWLYFVNDHHKLRRDLFGFGNYTGLIATLIFTLLLALSNDLSLGKLGAKRWKSLQRWVYAAGILTAAHAIAYQQIEKRILPFQAAMYALFAVLVIFQLVGVARLRQAKSA